MATVNDNLSARPHARSFGNQVCIHPPMTACIPANAREGSPKRNTTPAKGAGGVDLSACGVPVQRLSRRCGRCSSRLRSVRQGAVRAGFGWA